MMRRKENFNENMHKDNVVFKSWHIRLIYLGYKVQIKAINHLQASLRKKYIQVVQYKLHSAQ